MEKRTLKATTGFNVIRVPKKVTRLKMRQYGTCRGYNEVYGGDALYDGHFSFTYDITVKNEPILIRSYTYSYDHPTYYTVNGTGIYISWMWADEQPQIRIPFIEKYVVEYEYYLLKGGVVKADSGGVQRIEKDNLTLAIDKFCDDEGRRTSVIPDLYTRFPFVKTYDERIKDDYWRFAWSGDVKYKQSSDILQPYVLTVDMDLLNYDELEEE